MLYCENWDKIKERYLEFWAMENHDRPLMKITAPKDHQEAPPISNHASEKERWMDTEYVLKHAKCENCIFHSHIGFCAVLHITCINDARIFKPASYNSNIFNL